MERLRVGTVHAFARSASVGRQGLGLHKITLVPRSAWSAADDSQQERLWEDGDLIVDIGGITGYGDGYTERYLDIRFDPETLSGTAKPLEADQDRIFAEGQTLRSLMDDFKDRTDAQAQAIVRKYVGQWLEVSGVVIDVSVNENFDSLVSILTGPHEGCSLFFSDPDKLLEINKGDGIKVCGQIYSAASHSLSLMKCELIAIIPKTELEHDETSNDRPDTESREPPTDKPRLSIAALRAWHEAFKIAYPNGSKDLAEKSAVGAFPNHHVSRSRVRELFPHAQRGRPKKNNDLEKSPESDGE